MNKSPQPVTKKDLSIATAMATLWSFVFGLPLACLLLFLYLWRWGAILDVSEARAEDFLYFLIIIFSTLVLGSVLHELIHGFSWACFGHKPVKAFKFGFQWQTLTPYAHCREPMGVQAYRLGTIMPFVALGILPSSIGIAVGNGWIMFFGFFFTMAAGGDLLVLWLIRKAKTGQLVEDHPTQVGCYLIETQPE